MPIIYKSFELSKTGLPVPIFKSGKPMHSKYNPEKESESFVQNIEKADFFVVLGIGSGFHIQKIAENFPNSKIIGIEGFDEDIEFLKSNSKICANLENKENVVICSEKKLTENLCKHWIPAIYPSFSIIEYRIWCAENLNLAESIKKSIKETVEKISADYSVQVHFGKIWMHNILNNLKHNAKYSISFSDIKINKNKKAIVVAAGPSLESKIQYLKEKRNECTIISTDTAYKTLLSCNIESDFVCSVDAQNVSTEHFSKRNNFNTTFVFDLASNPSTPSMLLKNKKKIIFINSGHPLTCYIQLIYKNLAFEKLDTGSGTVTIAALDFAKKLGFSNIEILGADFSYPNAKPYCKGTYLEQSFLNKMNKLLPLETLYNKLMFRTKLIELNDCKTSQTLLSYKNSLEEWIIKNNFNYRKQDYIYFLNEIKEKHNSDNSQNNVLYNQYNSNNNFDYSYLKSILKEEILKEKKHKLNKFALTNLEKSMLPYISFLRKKKANNNFENLINLALHDFVRYT